MPNAGASACRHVVRCFRLRSRIDFSNIRGLKLSDSKQDTSFAVGIALEDTGGRTVRLVLDDLRTLGAPGDWRRWAFFTFMDLDRERMFSHQLEDRQYARIGEAIVARLIALQGVDTTKAFGPPRQSE